MDKKYFWKEVVPKKIKSNINTGGGVAIFSCILTAVMAIVIEEPFMFIDVVLGLILALGVLMGKSRVCAIGILLYYILGRVSLLMEGMMTSSNVGMIVVFVIAYINGIRGTFAYHKLKKQYIENPESINVN